MELNSLAIWLNETFAGFDQWMASWIHQLYNIGGSFFTPFFNFISFFGHDGIPLIIISLILLIFQKTRRFGAAMLLSLGIGALITNCALKVLIARARPYSEETKVFFNSDLYQKLWMTVGQQVESDKSFPSGHTTAAFATMTAVFLSGRKRITWIAFIFAILMAISRIYLVVHFASDVVAGIIVGILSGIIGTYLANKIPDSFYSSSWPFRKKIEASSD